MKVSPKSDRKLCLRPADYLPFARPGCLPPHPHPHPFHSLLTTLYLPSALTKGAGQRNQAVYLGGVSYCLGQAGNWKWCTVGTISTWLSTSMNNTATLLALASACGAPLSLPPANTFLFSSPPQSLHPPHFLLLECACLPGAESESNTCRTGRRLCHLKPCLNCCRGDQWDSGAI